MAVPGAAALANPVRCIPQFVPTVAMRPWCLSSPVETSQYYYHHDQTSVAGSNRCKILACLHGAGKAPGPHGHSWNKLRYTSDGIRESCCPGHYHSCHRTAPCVPRGTKDNE